MKKLRILFLSSMLLAGCLAFAQNKISLTNQDPIFMDITSTFNAGQPKKIITNNSQWLNYTTLVNQSEPTFSITVEVTSGSIPDGMELQIEASPYIGKSKGKPGIASKKIIVTNSPRVLIDNIGTCYTGSQRNEGHQLTFTFIITDYTKLQSGTSNIYLQYTITQ